MAKQKPRKETIGTTEQFFSAGNLPDRKEEEDDFELLRKIRQLIQDELAGLSISGKAGLAGVDGVQGEKGDTGATGATGPAGSSSDTTSIRKAYCKTAAGATAVIVCYLDTDGSANKVKVTCSIVNGSALNAAIPRLEVGDLIFVSYIGTTWYCTTVFQTTENCSCG